MRTMRSNMNLPAIVLLSALIAVLAYQAGANGTAMARPTAAASIDLPKVLENLRQRGDAEASVETMRAEVQAEQAAKIAALEALEASTADIQDEIELARIQDELALGVLEYERWLRFATSKLDIERSLRLQDLYRSIRSACDEMAAAEGYDVILVNDSLGELTVNPEAQVSREVQILQQITSRRMLFSSTSIDVTDDLIARMNNSYTAGAP